MASNYFQIVQNVCQTDEGEDKADVRLFNIEVENTWCGTLY